MHAMHPKTTKIQNLGKQREQSLCSLKIKISTNFPTNHIPSKILTQNVFQNPKFKGRTQCVQNYQNPRFRQAMRTIALFVENQKFSTNYPASLVLTKFLLELKNSKAYTTRPGFSHSIHNNIQNCIPSYSSPLQVKTNFQTVKSHSETKSNSKYFKIPN